MEYCSQHPRAPLPCAHCLSQAGRRSALSRATQEQILNNSRVEDSKKRREAVSRRIRDTFPSNAAFLKNNDTTTVVLVLKHGDKSRKRKERIMAIDDMCPQEVRDTLDQLFGDNGHVDKALRRAYRRSKGEEEEEEDGEGGKDSDDILADDILTSLENDEAGVDFGEDE